jgi:uncharacterized protein with FMN-binding domain
MKRALLIAGGTVGGLGAVLAITPPQLGSSSAINIAGGSTAGQGATAVASASSSTTSTEVATTEATNNSAATTKSSNPVASKKAAAKSTEPSTQAEETQAQAASSAKSINGTFTGPSVFVNYGNVQVKITVVNGRITDAVAVVAPSGRNDRWTRMSVPVLKQQTLAAQSANIQGVSGASYTSYGWYTSLQGALAEAGL